MEDKRKALLKPSEELKPEEYEKLKEQHQKEEADIQTAISESLKEATETIYIENEEGIKVEAPRPIPQKYTVALHGQRKRTLPRKRKCQESQGKSSIAIERIEEPNGSCYA